MTKINQFVSVHNQHDKKLYSNGILFLVFIEKKFFFSVVIAFHLVIYFFCGSDED